MVAYIFIGKEPLDRHFLQKLETACISSILFSSSFSVWVPTGKRWLTHRIIKRMFTELWARLKWNSNTKRNMPFLYNPASVLLGIFSQRNRDFWPHRILYMSTHRCYIPARQRKAENGAGSREQVVNRDTAHLCHRQTLSSRISQSKICFVQAVFFLIFHYIPPLPPQLSMYASAWLVLYLVLFYLLWI